MNKILLALILSGAILTRDAIAAVEEIPQAPKISLNGKPGNVTIQDLSGPGTWPLRALVNRNNKVRGNGFMQVYALGVRAGDELTMEIAVRTAGIRATVYKVFRGERGSPRYLSMPATFYFPEPKTGTYRERVAPFDSEYLLVVFEKTDSPDEKNIQVRYFEERERSLAITSWRTDLLFSTLVVKMKDFGEGKTAAFFERDAQFLIDRMTNPQRIILIRMWKIKP